MNFDLLSDSVSPRLNGAARERARLLYEQQKNDIAVRTDRLLSLLLLFEWGGTVLTALIVSPRVWAGGESRAHLHVWAALLLGGLVALPSIAIGRTRAGRQSTRYVVAVAQMLMGMLLIDVTGGRIETHFYYFGSLAFLAFYRDWRVIAIASLVAMADHFARGFFFPASVFGAVDASAWRSVEHCAWLAFEDLFLVTSCMQGQREMRDIAVRRAELELKMDVEARFMAAQEANRLKSDFLANMSHEIRTPMTAIQGYTDLLLDPSLDASERLNHTQVIRRNTEHLLTILNDVLDLSKIEAGKMTVESTDCSPARIACEVASLMRVRAAEKRLDFRLVFDTPLPATIKSDPTRLRQILFNLVGNAIKFTASGYVRVTVRCLDPASLSPCLQVDVKDSGIGLSEAEIERLFHPFTQADSSTTRKFGGSGLGLAICSRLAELLGGGIEVRSTPGSGSTFSLTVATGSLAGVIMLLDPKEAIQDETTTFVRSSRLMIPLEGRVLLAEDGRDNQLLLSTLLRKAGAVVTVAENGKIAVDKALAARAQGAPFDVILMDMQMPEMDGYAATSKLRTSGYDGPIVALTAHAMAGDRAQCIAAGCNEYLTKPIDRLRLLTTVRNFVGRARNGPMHSEVIAEAAQAALVSEYADDPELAEILVQFVDSLPARAGAMVDALARSDWSTLCSLAHQLKGAAGSYGFPSITLIAADIETAVKDGPPSEVTALEANVREVSSQCRRAAASPDAPPVASQRSA